VRERYQGETTRALNPFRWRGQGKKDEQKAGEAKPVYPVWLVYLVSLVDRKQRNRESQIGQKYQVN